MIPALLAALAAWLVLPVPAVRRLRSLDHDVPAPRAMPSLPILVTVLVPVGCLVLLGPFAGVLVAAAVTPLARAAAVGAGTSAQKRRRERAAAQLPGAVDLLVAVLASGRPAEVAFEVVGEVTEAPLGPELTAVGQRLRTAPDVGVLWSSLVGHPVLAPIARAFRRAEQSGAPVAGVVAAAAEEVRRDQVARAREKARAVSVRTAAPLGACFLPAFFLIGIVPTLIGVGSQLGSLLP